MELEHLIYGTTEKIHKSEIGNTFTHIYGFLHLGPTNNGDLNIVFVCSELVVCSCTRIYCVIYANLVNFTFSKVPVSRDKVVKV